MNNFFMSILHQKRPILFSVALYTSVEAALLSSVWLQRYFTALVSKVVKAFLDIHCNYTISALLLFLFFMQVFADTSDYFCFFD